MLRPSSGAPRGRKRGPRRARRRHGRRSRPGSGAGSSRPARATCRRSPAWTRASAERCEGDDGAFLPQEVNQTVEPIGLRAIVALTSSGECTRLPATATITSVGSSLPAAGKPGSIAATSAPARRRHLPPDARSATAAATSWEVFISDRSRPPPGRSSPRLGRSRRLGRDSRRSAARRQLLEQRRLAHDHVDEVDPAAVIRLVPAGDADERGD